nr:MAG TPA: hypothetical protein [Caudoviricetes sp.]
MLKFLQFIYKCCQNGLNAVTEFVYIPGSCGFALAP